MAKAESSVEQYDHGGLQPNALSFLQSIYGLDASLGKLSQTEALELAHGLTQTYFEHSAGDAESPAFCIEEQNRTRHVVHAYMSGQPLESIAEDMGYDDPGSMLLLNDFVREIERYNEASWTHSDIERDLMYAPDTDRLDKIRANVQQEAQDADLAKRRGPMALGEVSVAAFQPLASIEETHQTLQNRFNQKASAAGVAVDWYIRSPAYKRAIYKLSRSTGETEIFVINPEATSEDAEALRTMSWLVHRAIFMAKDGNTMADMRAYKDPRQDYHVLPVFYGIFGQSPLGAMYFKKQVPGGKLPSVEAIHTAWDKDIQEIFATAHLPDLQHNEDVVDIVTVGLLARYQGAQSPEAHWALMGMYNAFGRKVLELGAKHMVTVFDAAAAEMLNKYYEAFRRYAPESVIAPKSYDAPRGEDANWSLPRHCDVEDWIRNLPESKYKYYFGTFLDRYITITEVQ